MTRRTAQSSRAIRVFVGVAAIAALTLSTAACGPKSPDFQSILPTTATTNTTPTTTARPEPLWHYLEGVGVAGKQVDPTTLTDLTVSIPTPPGWAKFGNENITAETEIIAKGDSYPTAMLMVFMLRGDFDVTEALKHGSADAQLSRNFKQLDASTADYQGFPSAMVEGSYELMNKRLHAWNRVVFATGSPPANQRYLIQLTITSLAQQAYEQSDDIEAIIAGFKVAAK